MVQIALKIQLGCDGGANLNYEKFRQTNDLMESECVMEMESRCGHLQKYIYGIRPLFRSRTSRSHHRPCVP